MVDKILDIIHAIEPILLVVIPTCFGIYLRVKKKVEEKERSIHRENELKNREKLLDWEHVESIKVIDKIKHLCNYYKDVGHMDLVNYVQFENGTTATSKLCNMFLSCLAEDSRFSKIPKMISKFQRVPYGKMSSWVSQVVDNKEQALFISNKDSLDFHDDDDIVFGEENIKSFISCPVKDPNGMLIGICSFYYSEENWSGRTKEQCEDVMIKFVSSLEAIFLEYNYARLNMKKSLNLA